MTGLVSRPDWIKCIHHPMGDMAGKAMCGRQLGALEWAFVDICHAWCNAKRRGRLLTCRECAKAIVVVFEQQPHEQ